MSYLKLYKTVTTIYSTKRTITNLRLYATRHWSLAVGTFKMFTVPVDTKVTAIKKFTTLWTTFWFHFILMYQSNTRSIYLPFLKLSTHKSLMAQNRRRYSRINYCFLCILYICYNFLTKLWTIHVYKFSVWILDFKSLCCWNVIILVFRERSCSYCICTLSHASAKYKV